MPPHRLAIVVIGRNEGPRLAACLASAPDGVTVVYADSASTDDSVTMARAAGAEVVALHPDTPLTAARGRNAGAAKAIALDPDLAFIQFVDGDCTILPEWLPAAVDFLTAHPEVAVVCGRRFERHPERSLYNAMCDREWNTPVGQADASGGDALVRVRAFAEVGGFADDQVAHEEPEMCGRLRAAGWTIWRLDVPMTAHDANITRLGQFYRRSRRAGLGISQCLDRGGAGRDPQGAAIVRRALIWGVALPVAIIASLAIDARLAAVMAAAYPAQLLRQTARNRRQGWTGGEAVRVAALGIVSKFAEAHGVVEYWMARLTGRRHRPVTYK
ncbi:MAG: glycosyltransferase [Sphingomonas phyllosphaerae]|uniref:glycosyltransferase n=1 Tax=Sphingomonas phyllosphaerae TaxID=257003 RepID=UPI002FF4F8FE